MTATTTRSSENLLAIVNGDFAYGRINVFVPYRSRCHRYRLYPDKSIRYLESHPCNGAT